MSNTAHMQWQDIFRGPYLNVQCSHPGGIKPQIFSPFPSLMLLSAPVILFPALLSSRILFCRLYKEMIPLSTDSMKSCSHFLVPSALKLICAETNYIPFFSLYKLLASENWWGVLFCFVNVISLYSGFKILSCVREAQQILVELLNKCILVIMEKAKEINLGSMHGNSQEINLYSA